MVKLTQAEVGQLKKLCSDGSHAACADLGILFLQGPASGVEHDAPRAASLFAGACDGGDARACTQLGALQLAGKGGVARDTVNGMLNVQKGCRGDDGDGCFMFGKLLYSGQAPGGKNPDRAAQYFLHACGLGHAPCAQACAVVGSMFWERCGEGGGAANCSNAARCFGRGCALGSSDACGQISDIYPAVGSACAAGDEEACKLREAFRAAMPAAMER